MSNDPFDRDREPAPTLEQQSEEARPFVARPPDRFTLPLILLGSVALGALVFYFLSQGRQQPQVAQVPPPAPPPAIVAAPPPVPPPVVVTLAPPAPAPAPVVTPPPAGPDAAQLARWKSPSLVVDLSGVAQPPAAAPGAPAPGTPAAALSQALQPPGARPADQLTADERFAARLGVGEGEGAAQATRIAHLATTVPQGSMVTAVLETAINSDLPGYVRAVVSREVRSFDGSKVVIPRGSHVIGQYRSGIALGQSRVFVVWTRLIRPDGASIEMASAGTDALGRGGLEGDVDSHFFARFGGAILLSLLSITGDALTDNRQTQVVINSTQNAGNAASVALQQQINISPTIEVPSGTPLRIFVARDLDFSAVEAAP